LAELCHWTNDNCPHHHQRCSSDPWTSAVLAEWNLTRRSISRHLATCAIHFLTMFAAVVLAPRRLLLRERDRAYCGSRHRPHLYGNRQPDHDHQPIIYLAATGQMPVTHQSAWRYKCLRGHANHTLRDHVTANSAGSPRRHTSPSCHLRA
jgi:hypothetical protein